MGYDIYVVRRQRFKDTAWHQSSFPILHTWYTPVLRFFFLTFYACDSKNQCLQIKFNFTAINFVAGHRLALVPRDANGRCR